MIEQLKKLTFPFSQVKKEETCQFMINYSFFSAIGWDEWTNRFFSLPLNVYLIKKCAIFRSCLLIHSNKPTNMWFLFQYCVKKSLINFFSIMKYFIKINPCIQTRFLWKIDNNMILERKLLFSIDDLCWIWYHSIENLILHLTQPFSESTHVVKRIGTKFTYRIRWKT